jgi:hypothetical protein
VIRRLLAAAALAAAVLAGPAATPALAFGPDLNGSCAAAPVPTDPNTGLVQNWGGAGTSEKGLTTDFRFEHGIPPQADPFAPGATTTIYEQYGPSQFSVHIVPANPDEACILQSPIGTIMFEVANAALGPVEIVWSAVTELGHYAMVPGQWTRYVDPLVVQGVQVAHNAVWTPYSALLFLFLGCWLMWIAAGHGRHATIRMLAALACIAGAVVLVTTTPLYLAQHEDALIQQGARYAVTAGHLDKGGRAPTNPGEAIAGVASDALLFDQWCNAQVGVSAASPIGKRYCPRLFKDQARTYAEAAYVDADPAGKGKALLKAKQDDWVAAWKEIADKYPANLEYGRGQHSGDALMAVLFDWLGTGCIIPIVLGGLVVMFGAYIVGRLGTIAVPVYGTVALVPRAQHIAATPFKWMGYAVVNVVGWFTAIVIHSTMVAGILSPSVALPSGVRLTLCAVMTWFVWKALKPLRSFTRSSIGRGFDPAAEAGGGWQSAKGLVKSATAGYFGPQVGAASANRHHDRRDEEEHTQGEPGDSDVYGGDPDTSTVLLFQDPGRRRREEPQATAPDLSWEQVPDDEPATTREPAAAFDAPPAPPTALPAGTGREGTTTFHDAAPRTGEPSPTDVPDTTPMQPVHPETVGGEEVYVIYDPATRGFAASGEAGAAAGTGPAAAEGGGLAATGGGAE